MSVKVPPTDQRLQCLTGTRGVDVTPSFGLQGPEGTPLYAGALEERSNEAESLNCPAGTDAVVETENLEDKFCGVSRRLSTSATRCLCAIRLRLVRMNTMTPRVNESRPRNENTVMIAIKDPGSFVVDALFCVGGGDDVGCDVTCELDCDCALADEADVAWVDRGAGLGGTDVPDTEVPGPPTDGLAAAGPPCDGITTGGAGTAGGEGKRIIVGVCGDAGGTVGGHTAGGVTAGGIAVPSVDVATGGS
jgi:hypothetical protein